MTHLDDARPAWLWGADGTTLIWRNEAARLFGAKRKRGASRLMPMPVPIRGQVARLLRLGVPGQPSLARVQFLAAERPVSATCACTPLPLPDGQTGLLIVAVDPIDAELLAAEAAGGEPVVSTLLADADYLILDPAGRVTGGSRQALGVYARLAPELAEALEPDGPAAPLEADGEMLSVVRRAIGDSGASLLTFSAVDAAEIAGPEAGETSGVESSGDAGDDAGSDDEPAPEPPPMRDLGALIDRLAGEQSQLFAPLGTADDAAPEPPVVGPEPEAAPPALWRVTGRGFAPLAEAAPEAVAAGPEDMAVAPAFEDATPEGAVPEATPANAEAADDDRVARYNFDELSRLLSDRIGGEPEPDAGTAASPPAAARNEARLLPLSDDMLVLNRLPLGVLVFRDQAILFANRALVEMVGFPDLASLRAGGLEAVFPQTNDDGAAVGPVTRLSRRDGGEVPVTARLQSITWQGHPALLLTARAEDAGSTGEAAVKSFCRALAEARDEGYFELGPTGVVTSVSARAAALFGAPPEALAGRPLSALVRLDDVGPLHAFLDTPARFAETERAGLALRGVEGATELTVFAEGRAGVVEGYFGTVRAAAGVPADGATATGDGDAALLARLGRSIRRPLNTVIGFSELIRAEAFGPVGNARYAEYARDIRTAGVEITALIDELEDFVRLGQGHYSPAPVEIDLAELLEAAVGRLRGLAGTARVLLRTAISRELPRVRVDRASLAQALVNLLASAIAETPQGGQVILSAQAEDDGGVGVHVRDSAVAGGDFAERFVVVRDGTFGEELRTPIRSSLGLALTRSLLAVNDVGLSVDPTAGTGTLVTLSIPPASVVGRTG